MTKGPCFCLMLLVLPVMNWAAANQTAATPAKEPTEISFEELIRMEIPVVEAASKYKQKTTEAPSSITIITSDEVKKYGHRTLADILQSVPGMYVSYDRNYSYLGVRAMNVPGLYTGEANNRMLLLV